MPSRGFASKMHPQENCRISARTSLLVCLRTAPCEAGTKEESPLASRLKHADWPQKARGPAGLIGSQGTKRPPKRLAELFGSPRSLSRRQRFLQAREIPTRMTGSRTNGWKRRPEAPVALESCRLSIWRPPCCSPEEKTENNAADHTLQRSGAPSRLPYIIDGQELLIQGGHVNARCSRKRRLYIEQPLPAGTLAASKGVLG